MVTESVFERMYNSSLLSMSNEFPECILVEVIQSWREVILFVFYQSWKVSLIRYGNGIPSDPMRVASSCIILDLTSYHFVIMNEGIVTKNSVLWEVALGSSMEYSSITESNQSQSNAVTLAVSYSTQESFTEKSAQW